MTALYVEIKGPIDSRALFEQLGKFGKVNVTDMHNIVLVYGDLPFDNAVSALSLCSAVGDVIKASIHKV